MRVFSLFLLSVLLSPHLAATAQSDATEQPMALRDAQLPPAIQKDIVAAIVEDNKGSAEDSELQELELNSSVSFLALSRTGAKTILVVANGSSLSGNHGNCPYYLFMNKNSRAVLIWGGNGPKVELAVHHGMHDISSIDVMSAEINDAVEVLEFDGKAYKPAYCYEVKDDENGRRVSRRHPCH